MRTVFKTLIKLTITFIIAVLLSAVISTILHLIFLRQPELIIKLNSQMIITSIISNKEHLEMFILIVVAFMMFAILAIFKISNLKDYKSKTYRVTNNIEIPLPVGGKQTQQGSAWWLEKKDFKKNFGINKLDLSQPEIKKLLELVEEDREYINENKVNNSSERIDTIFKKGGLVVGKRDRHKLIFYCKKIKNVKILLPKIKKIEDIYYIDDDLHSLTVGATRSGKTRSLVLQSIVNTGLAGENMIISDPKR